MSGRLMAVMLLFACGLAYAQQQGGTFVMDDIAAVVGSEIILSSEIKGLALRQAQQLGVDPNDTTAMKKLSNEVLDEEVSNAVLLYHAKQEKIEASDEEVSRMVDQQIAELRKSYSSDAQFQRDLESVGQTLSGLREMYRESSRKNIMRQNYLQEHSHELPQVKVTEEEARELFEQQPVGNSPAQVKFQFMVIAPKPGEAEVARAKARIDSLYKVYLEGGVDFAWLAEHNSDGPSATNGGDLGYFSRGEMVKEFEDAAFSMRVGDVRMVQTKYGWHLIRVEARRQKEVRARHILAATEITDDDWQKAYNLAQSLRERVMNGENFYQLAREYSDQQEELSESPGFSILSDIQPPEFRDALMGDLTPLPDSSGARISEPIEMRPHGWLLMYELERKDEAPLKFEDVKRRVIESLEYPKRINAYVDELREKTYVDIRFKGWAPIAGSM